LAFVASDTIPKKNWQVLYDDFGFQEDEEGEPIPKTVEEVEAGFPKNGKKTFYVECWRAGKFISPD